MIHQNVGSRFPSDTAPYPRRMETSTTTIWRPTNSYYCSN